MSDPIDLTDEQIRAEWDACGILLRAECYYALKRNARARDGLQGDDEFSLFCEESARAVAKAITDRIHTTPMTEHQLRSPSMGGKT